MTEIDLIPSDYRRRRVMGRWTGRIGRFALGLVALMLASAGLLGYLTQETQARLAELQTQKAVSTQQRAELEALRAEKTKLEQQLRLLNGLRSGTAAKAMFKTVDQALEGDSVWFEKWGFRRAGTPVEHAPEGKNTGYFIVVPSGRREDKPQTWQIETHMSIRGQALDYAAFSGFVSRLIEQAEIQDVRVLKTGLRQAGGVNVVDFEIAVTVQGEPGRG
jgi:cell division protein FtsB